MTDHRIGLTLYKIDSILDGGLDDIIDALITADRGFSETHNMYEGHDEDC